MRQITPALYESLLLKRYQHSREFITSTQKHQTRTNWEDFHLNMKNIFNTRARRCLDVAVCHMAVPVGSPAPSTPCHCLQWWDFYGLSWHEPVTLSQILLLITPPYHQTRPPSYLELGTWFSSTQYARLTSLCPACSFHKILSPPSPQHSLPALFYYYRLFVLKPALAGV